MKNTRITVETRANNVIICSFSNILPINDVEEGIRRGRFTSYKNFSFITNKTIRLAAARGAKSLSVVCFNRAIKDKEYGYRDREYVDLLFAEGKQPCRKGPQYLLGLMAQVPEDKMPDQLRDKEIVAAEWNDHSGIFADRHGDRCYLSVAREGSMRWLCLSNVVWRADQSYVSGQWNGYQSFLAEDLAP